MKVMCFRIFVLVLLLVSFRSAAQEMVLRGVVTDANGPLVGATVALYNADNRAVFGVITNANGEYFIRVPADRGVTKVVFSFVGYKTKEVNYSRQSVLDARLQEELLTLDEAVVTARSINQDAMGMDTKALGGARQKIDLDDLQDMVVTSVGDMLQGKIANMDLVASSGAPGAKMNIRIRGTASLNTSNEPLIVIDGIPQADIDISSDFDFGTATEEDFGALVNISPSDIQDIEVLKDASATAIWGDQAANGVLVITTKRGKMSKPTFEITEKVSTSIEPKKMPLLNAREYVTLMNDAIWNNIRDNEYTNLGLMNQYQDIRYNPNYRYFREFNQDVDWLDYIVRTPINSETNFSMSGGGQKASYRFSIGYLTEEGTTVGEDFKRITSRLNLDYRFSDKFRFSSQFSYSEGDRNSSYNNPRGIARTKMPNLTPFVLDDEGNFTDEYFNQPSTSIQGSTQNPVALAYEAVNNAVNRNGGINFDMNYQILKNLRFQATVSFSMSANSSKSFLPASATGSPMNADNYNQSNNNSSQSNSLYMTAFIQYNTQLAKRHRINASARFTAQDNESSSYGSTSHANPVPSLGDPSNNGNLNSMSAGQSETRNVAFVGSLLYTYNDRVNLNVAFRTQGNSKTGRDSRWGTFPSISLSWYLNQEPFLKKATWLYDLRPRFAWGISGSSPSGSSTYAGTYDALTSNYVDMTATKPTSMQMNKLKWQSVHQYNFGLDFGIFDDRFHLAAEYYIKTTYDLLQQNMSIPSSTGYSTIPWFNDGSIQNRGWEIYLRGNRIVDYAGFRVNVDFNISRNRNKVLDLPMNLEYMEPSVTNGSYINKVMEGRPLGSFFGFRYLGVYQNVDDTYARDVNGNVIKDAYGKNVITRINGTWRQRPGDAKYYDVNKDGVIDKYDVVYLGSSQPLFLGGGGITLMYKGISLRGSVAYRVGQSVINRALLNAEQMSGGNNQSTSVLRRWRYEGDDTDIPRALWGTNYNSLGSDRYVNKASFMKVKDITLSYRFQKNLLDRLKLRTVNVYLTCYDPFTITKYKGQDPEVGIPSSFRDLAEDNSLSPRARRFAFGMTIGF